MKCFNIFSVYHIIYEFIYEDHQNIHLIDYYPKQIHYSVIWLLQYIKYV